MPPRSNARSATIVRSWADGLSDALALVNPPDKARDLFGRYRDAFSAGFQEAYPPTVAAGDIRMVESLSEQRPLGVDFHHRMQEEQRAVGLKVWSLARPLPLSERVPVLENMGFRVVDERTYHIDSKGQGARHLVPRHAAGAPRRRHDRSRRRQGAAGSRLPDGDAWAGRKRRLQRAHARGQPSLARRGGDPHAVALPAPGTRALFAGLHVGDAGQARWHSRQHRGVVSRPLRSAFRRPRKSATPSRKRLPRASKRNCRRSTAWTRIAFCAASSTQCSRRSAPISSRPTKTATSRR